MTTTRRFTVTTTLIRRGDKTALSTSYDFTVSDILTPALLQKLLSPTDQAIKQWWDSLTTFQKSALGASELNFKISANFLTPQLATLPPKSQE